MIDRLGNAKSLLKELYNSLLVVAEQPDGPKLLSAVVCELADIIRNSSVETDINHVVKLTPIALDNWYLHCLIMIQGIEQSGELGKAGLYQAAIKAQENKRRLQRYLAEQQRKQEEGV
jgi:hypothetical protein